MNTVYVTPAGERLHQTYIASAIQFALSWRMPMLLIENMMPVHYPTSWNDRPVRWH